MSLIKNIEWRALFINYLSDMIGASGMNSPKTGSEPTERSVEEMHLSLLYKQFLPFSSTSSTKISNSTLRLGKSYVLNL